MSKGWPLVRVGDILQLQRRWLKLDPTQMYVEIGIRSFGKGIFRKVPVAGASLGNKRVLQIHPGDLVFNNVFAWEGAVAVAGDAEAGKIGSHRFVTYTVRGDCSAEYLKLFFTARPGLEVLQRVSPGSAGRNRTLNLDHFAAQTIPLPPPAEQRRIVTHIEALSERITEARRMREEASEEADAFLTLVVTTLLRDVPLSGRLGDILREKPRNGWSARCAGLDDGTPVLSLGAVTGFRYRPEEFKRTSEPTIPGAHYWLREGDLLVTRSNTPELVGHVAIYDGRPTPCIYPDLMMRLDVDEEKADKRFIVHLLKCTPVRDYIKRNAKGTSPTMKKISQDIVMKIPFPTHLPRTEQSRIVERLDDLQGKVDSLRTLQAETTAELDALLPAVLAQAFAGRL
jgi:type I restriction enzyme, S subunit